jgi:hypothetical protein
VAGGSIKEEEEKYRLFVDPKIKYVFEKVCNQGKLATTPACK